jgi:hypothetical protein
MLRDGATPVAHVDYDNAKPEGLARTYTALLGETAKYLKTTVTNSDWPFPYFDPTFHFFHGYGKPTQLWLKMKFFDGGLRSILLASGLSGQWEADKLWGPAMDAYTLQLEDVSGAPSAQRVVIYDKNRKPVRIVSYDSASPEGHKASQAQVMEALRETYVLHKASLPARMRLQ